MWNFIARVTIVILGILVTESTYASSERSITFVGRIVESTCRVNPKEKDIDIICLSGEKQTKEMVNIKELFSGTAKKLTFSMVSYLWVDKKNAIAIVTTSHL